MSLVGPARVIFGFLFQKHYQEAARDVGASVITGHDYAAENLDADDKEAAYRRRNAHVRRMYPRITRFCGDHQSIACTVEQALQVLAFSVLSVGSG